MDVADKYPDATVYGIDLFPPPHNWVPPNCVLEVEDVSKEWTWKQKFDLIHMYANCFITSQKAMLSLIGTARRRVPFLIFF